MNDRIEHMQYVTFSLAGELFAVEVTRAREILDLVPITSVPQTPDYLLGVINLRGQVVPVIDMRRKLGMADAERTKDGCIIVLETCCDGDMVIVGVLVDQVQEVLELGSHQIEPAPRLGTKLRIDFIRGLGKVNERFLILLDIDRIFSCEEIELASELNQNAVKAVES